MLTVRTLRTTWAVSLTLLIAAILAAGCGEKQAANVISGKVTLDGDPVFGNVVFVSADNKEVSSPTATDGTYRIENPPVGQVKVLVKGMPGQVTGGAPPPKDAPAMSNKQGVAPPPKYAAATSSDLSYEVKAGKHTYNIELKK